MAAPTLLGKNPELPYDLQTEQAQLAIQQAIAMELLKQGLQPVPQQEAGGMALPNWGDQTAAGAQIQLAQSQLRDVGKRQGELAGRYNKELADAMQRYTATRFGQPGTPDIPGPPDELGGGPPVPGTPGTRPDLVGAIAQAAGSRLPAMQALAAGDIKEAPGGKDILQYMKEYGPGRERFLGSLSPTDLPSMPQYHQAGDVGVTTQGGIPIGKTPTQTWGPTGVERESGLFGQTSPETGQFKPSIAGSYPTNFMSGLPGVHTEMIKETLKEARQAQEAIRGISQIEADLQAIPQQALGAGSNAKLFVNKWIETIGGEPIKWVPDVENVKGQFKQIMAQKIRQFAPVSDSDIKMALSMIGEDFTVDGMKKMLAFLRQANENTIGEHKKNVEAYVGNLPEQFQASTRQLMTPYFKQSIIPPARGAVASPGVPTASAVWGGPPNSPWAGKTSEQLIAEYERQRKLQGGK